VNSPSNCIPAKEHDGFGIGGNHFIHKPLDTSQRSSEINDAPALAGDPGVQLTWMDAKIGDWVVTPRQGKPGRPAVSRHDNQIYGLTSNLAWVIVDGPMGKACAAGPCRF
jgi:hypothetical protein